MELKNKIELVSKLLNFASLNNLQTDEMDIRSITIDAITQNIQNYFIALKLSENLEDIDYVKEEIWKEFIEEDLEVVNDNFHGFVKDAFFNAFFISVETNFRAVATYFEAVEGQINKTSIKKTFTNLVGMIVFFSKITKYEKDVILYFFYLRNTVHNFGIHTKPNHSLEIEDETSLIDQSKVRLELVQNQPNNISAKNQFLLLEQVIKVVLKFNSLIPTNEIVKHPLADFDYNS